MLKLDLIGTLALAGLALLAGYGLRRVVPVLARFNFPAPVIGGMLVAVAVLLARERGVTLLDLDTTLQQPLMIAFFTTIGFSASLSLLRHGGPLMLRFFLLATAFALLQNLVGVAMALAFGLNPLFGVLTGSVTLAGGPATGLAFAPLFGEAGVPAAPSIALAAAMGGIVVAGLIGGPVSTVIIERHRLRASDFGLRPDARSPMPEAGSSDETRIVQVLLSFVALLVAMWIGAWISLRLESFGITLPGYIGAMLIAAVLRNVDDYTGWLRLSASFMRDFGAVALSLFLVLALMTLRLWELAGLALPLVAILLVQVALAVLISLWPVFQLMGRDYEAAVMTGGFIGFMLGTTANAMAIMRALVERYGPAPAAFLVAPMVGAFFIDFSNALLITVFLNVFR